MLMLTMLASSETLGSSKPTLLIFHIRPLEAETKIQISCFNRPIFKKILKDDKKKKQFKSTVPFNALRFQQSHH